MFILATESVAIGDGRLVFDGTSEPVFDTVERQLRRRYGRGVFVHDHRETAEGTVLLHLGVAYPRDVSGSPETDDVLRFVNVGGVATLHATQTERGRYVAPLPDRSDFVDAFRQRRAEQPQRVN